MVVGTSRFDRRHTLLVLTSLLVLSSFIAAFSSGLVMLLLSRALLGIGLGGFWAMSLALAMRLVPGDRDAPGDGHHHGRRIGGHRLRGADRRLDRQRPRLALCLRHRRRARRAGVRRPGPDAAGHALQRTGQPRHHGPPCCAGPAIRLVLATILLAVAGHFAGFTFIRPFLEDVPQFDIDGVSQILLAFGIGGFFGNFAGGFMAERNTSLSLAMAAGGVAVMALLLGFAGASPVIAAVVTALWGFAFGAFPVSVQSFVNQAASDEPESAGALMLTTFQIAISSGAVLRRPDRRQRGAGRRVPVRRPVGTGRRHADRPCRPCPADRRRSRKPPPASERAENHGAEATGSFRRFSSVSPRGVPRSSSTSQPVMAWGRCAPAFPIST